MGARVVDDVLRFEISVADVLAVCECQSLQDLMQDDRDCGLCHQLLRRIVEDRALEIDILPPSVDARAHRGR